MTGGTDGPSEPREAEMSGQTTGMVTIAHVYGMPYEMRHVGDVTDRNGYVFPAFGSACGYQIDLGGAVGLTDPVEAGTDEEALALFGEEV